MIAFKVVTPKGEYLKQEVKSIHVKTVVGETTILPNHMPIFASLVPCKLVLKNENDEEMKKILLEVYKALNEKGYNSVSQIVGYILSEDPTYITTHNNARSLVRKLDRDELLQSMVEDYLGIKK